MLAVRVFTSLDVGQVYRAIESVIDIKLIIIIYHYINYSLSINYYIVLSRSQKRRSFLLYTQ